MTKGEAVNWIINLSADIGKAEYRNLWHYEQALDEIRELLELPSVQPEETIEEQERGIDEALRVARDIATIIENEQDMRVISQNAGQWIPVSEALPDRYIVGGDGKHYSLDVLMTVIYRSDDDIFIDYGRMVDDEWYSEIANEIITSPFEVVAWMPMPECYKGEQDE